MRSIDEYLETFFSRAVLGAVLFGSAAGKVLEKAIIIVTYLIVGMVVPTKLWVLLLLWMIATLGLFCLLVLWTRIENIFSE